MRMTALHAALLAALACFALVSCDHPTTTDRTVGQKLDSAIDKTEQKLAEAVEKTHQKLVEAGDKLAQRTDKVADELALNASKGTAETGKAMSDAAISASIKADLLKDPDLSVLKIDVDTKAGVVSLNGLADSAEARARAERIASAVKGVKEVHNYLAVKRVG